MGTRYRFLRLKNGMTAFAGVELSTEINFRWEILWDQSIRNLYPIYSHAVDVGVGLAGMAHENRGGKPQRVTVMSITEVAVDTKPDAVTCASALALWLSLGHQESDVQMTFNEGIWTPVFS